MISSASSPASSMHGIEKARVATRISGNCGDQIVGRRRTVRLILVVHLVAVGMLRRVEDHRHVRRPIRAAQVAGELPQHGRIAIDRARRLAVPVGERRQPVIGAEDVAGAVDQIEVRRRGCLGGWRAGVRHGDAGLAGWGREGSGAIGQIGSPRSSSGRSPLVPRASLISLFRSGPMRPTRPMPKRRTAEAVLPGTP